MGYFDTYGWSHFHSAFGRCRKKKKERAEPLMTTKSYLRCDKPNTAPTIEYTMKISTMQMNDQSKAMGWNNSISWSGHLDCGSNVLVDPYTHSAHNLLNENKRPPRHIAGRSRRRRGPIRAATLSQSVNDTTANCERGKSNFAHTENFDRHRVEGS